MIGGQCVDVESEGTASGPRKLDFIYRLKTSALIEASMMVGAVLAGASDERSALLERVAGRGGIGFPDPGRYSGCDSTTEVLGKAHSQ